MNDDLNTPQTLRLYGVVNADLPTNAKAGRFCVWIRCWVSAKDYVGHALEIPLEVQQLVNDREELGNKRIGSVQTG